MKFLFAKKRVLLYWFALLRWSCCYATSQAIDIQIAVFTCSAGSISYRTSSTFDRCFTENLLVLISNAILPKATQRICNQIFFCLLNPAHKRCPLFGYFVPFVSKVFFVHNGIFNPVFSSSYFDKLWHLVDDIAQRFIYTGLTIIRKGRKCSNDNGDGGILIVVLENNVPVAFQ